MALRAQSVSFAYHPSRPVLRDITCEMAAGEITAVLGPNASGKTTLLRLLLGLRRPTSGVVALDGRDVTQLSARTRAAHMAYVPQHPSLAFAFTVREAIALGRCAVGLSHQATDEAMERLGIAALADEPVNELSAGQRHLAAIARVMAQLAGAAHPQVLLADEPLAPLDPAHALRLRGAFADLAAEGVAIGVVIHDVTTAAMMAPGMIVLDQTGRAAAVGPTRTVCTPELLSRVYGVPFHRQMLDDGREAILPASPTSIG